MSDVPGPTARWPSWWTVVVALVVVTASFPGAAVAASTGGSDAVSAPTPRAGAVTDPTLGPAGVDHPATGAEAGVAPRLDADAVNQQALATVCAFDGQNVTADNIALTSFYVSAPSDPPTDGQNVSVSFVLENWGQSSFSFHSVLLRGTTPDGYREFGAVSSVSLAPGEAYTFEVDVPAAEGDWELWPAYVDANGQSSPSPWQPCAFTVVPPPDTEPPSVSIELSPGTSIADDENLTITGSATDLSGIAELRVLVDGIVRRSCTESPCAVTLGPFEPGTYASTVEAVDGAGNVGAAGSSFEVAATASPLTVEVDTYVPPANTSLPTVVAAQALGDVEVASLTIVVDGEPTKTCDGPTCAYETELAPGTEHTIGAVAEDTSGRFAESVGGVEGTTVDIPRARAALPPAVTYRYPVGSRVFERPDRLAFDVFSADPLVRVRLFGFGETASDYETLCGPIGSAPACPEHAVSFDEDVPYDTGWNPIAVTVDTESGYHLNARKDVTYTDPETIEAWVNATHAPSSPAPGESVALRATVQTEWEIEAVSSLELRQLSFGGPDEVIETCTFEGFATNISCEATYEPPDGRHVMYYYAVATVAGDREVTSDPRPVVFDDGPDADDDGLTDYEERFLCTDERNPDTDGDGLLDSWEVYGHRFPDGHVVDLPAMGSHPCQRDAFLEIDWWGNATHNHKPAPFSLTMTKQAFRRGGIRLHIDDGKWGGGEETPHHDLFEFPPDYYYEGGYEYKLRKDDHFDPHRLWSFHYAVFRHRDGRSVYVYPNSVSIATPDNANWDFEASELFHEFGHSIGMGHGGRRGERVQRRSGDLVTYYGRWDGAPNRKPNYVSGMNYAYYGATYWNAAEESFVASYDYSRAALPDLNESDLDERSDSDFARALRDYPLPPTIDEAPPGVADDWVPVVRYGCLDPDETERVLWYEMAKPVVMVSDGRQTLARKVAGEPWQTTDLPEHPPGIDWDCDGRIEASVEMNINGDGGDGGLLADPATYTWGEVLEGREDWSKIPNRHPCPGDQQTERTIPGTDETYDVAPAPSDAFVHEGHDPPCDAVALTPSGSLEPPGAGLEPGVPDLSPSAPADKSIIDERDELGPVEFCNLLDDDADGAVDEGCSDVDADGYPDEIDNCPTVANPTQADSNGDFVGDACSGLPPAPAGLVAQRTDDGVALSWEPVNGTSGYVVWRRAGPDAPLEYVGGYPTTTTASFVDTAANPAESTTYVVRAVNAMTGTEGRAASVTAAVEGEGQGIFDDLPAVPIAVGAAILAIAGALLYARRRVW